MTAGERIKDEIIKHMGYDCFNICFMPYKKDMWDSMESVYEAFNWDENFYGNIYLNPMPYYKFGENGKIDSICCEFGDCWKRFDPSLINESDVIVIHNPYDKNNSVTETLIHSKVFKLMGKVLVYIPYFCASDNVKDITVCQTGLLNADMIFVESERQKANYVRCLKERTHKDYSSRIFATGSPKFDALQKDYVMPDEWREAKNSGKELVLFCTSLIPFIENPQKKLKQIRDILNEYKNRDDAYLIYRPHPLLEQSIKRLSNSNYELYIQMIADSKKNLYLDTSQEFDRAIVLADRCISDQSSLVYLWQSTKKPLTMI